jgi:hypothetical protein
MIAVENIKSKLSREQSRPEWSSMPIDLFE